MASAQPGINWTLIGSGDDPDTGDKQRKLPSEKRGNTLEAVAAEQVNRFGRVDNCLWKTSTTTLAQIEYGYGAGFAVAGLKSEFIWWPSARIF